MNAERSGTCSQTRTHRPCMVHLLVVSVAAVLGTTAYHSRPVNIALWIVFVIGAFVAPMANAHIPLHLE